MLLAGLTQRLKSRVRERERRRSVGTPNSSGMMLTARMRREREHAKLVMEREGRQKLNPDAKPYEYDPDVPDVSDNDEGDDSDPIKRAYLGRRLYSKVYSQQPVCDFTLFQTSLMDFSIFNCFRIHQIFPLLVSVFPLPFSASPS